jgi:hypothetical protein
MLGTSDQRGFTRRHAGPKAKARSVTVKVPLEWVWTNDPDELPDDDHARCIAAPGERFLACGAELFTLTTRPCLHLSDAHGGHPARSFSTLQMEYRGLDWVRGLAQRSWGSDRFDCGSAGGEAQQAAGLALLATLEGALAAGGPLHRSSSAPVHIAVGALGQLPRPAAWHPPGHAPRKPRPALLPLRVGRGKDPR